MIHPPPTQHKSREDRYGNTTRKHLTLTVEAIDAIQAYATRHELYFSVAIESLALMGLGHATAESLPRIVSNLIERVLNQQFNRFAKLLSLSALSAEEASYKMDALLLQIIWREARLDPESFGQSMLVSNEPDAQPDATARQLRDSLKSDAKKAALARLKAKLPKNETLIKQEVHHE